MAISFDCNKLDAELVMNTAIGQLRDMSAIKAGYRRMTKAWLPRVYADFQYFPRSNHVHRRSDDQVADQLVPMSQQQGSPEKKMEDTEPMSQSGSPKKKRANPEPEEEELSSQERPTSPIIKVIKKGPDDGAYVFAYCKEHYFYYVKLEDLPPEVQQWCQNKQLDDNTRNMEFSCKLPLIGEDKYHLFAKCEEGK